MSPVHAAMGGVETGLLLVLAASLAFLAWTFVGYAMAMRFLAWFSPRAPRRRPWTPSVTVCIAVHDGAEHVDAKLASIASQAWPSDRLEVVVVSDGSTDDTLARLSSNPLPNLRVLEGGRRRGKTACLADAIALARGEVLVFTDIRQRLGEGAIAALCEALGGGDLVVAGGLLRFESAPGYAQGVEAYWAFETALRRAEAATGSVVGVSGALYAIRRADMPIPPPCLVLDDLWVPMVVAGQGGRVGLVDDAVAWDRPSPHPAAEARRKRRTLAGNWQLVGRHPDWLVPGRHPLAWRFLQHKVARLVAPLALVGAFASSATLAMLGHPWGGPLLAAQTAAYALAFAGLANARWRRVLPVRLCSTFLEMNAYAALGAVDAWRGHVDARWATAAAPRPPLDPPVAPPEPRRP